MSILNPRYVHATFCDDVRMEMGGKISLMGIYQGSLHLSGPALPLTIPRICVVVEARTPSTDPFKKLIVRVYLDDKLLVEGASSEEQLEETTGAEEVTYKTIGLIFNIQPFVVENEGRLKVRVDTDEGEIKAGGLQILFSPIDKPEPAIG